MIEEILKQAVAEHASDIFLIPGMAYGFKLGGTIVHKGEEKIFQEEMNRLITELYHTAGERSMERVTSCGDDDFSFLRHIEFLNCDDLRRSIYGEGNRCLIQHITIDAILFYQFVISID